MFRQLISSTKFSSILVFAALLLVSSMVFAADSSEKSVKVEKTDQQIIITAIDDDGESETTVIDLSGISGMIDEALTGIESSQFQLRLGHDNMVSFAMDDTAVEVDLDVILSQVGAALSHGLEEFHASEWASHGPRSESHLAEDELAMELENLREEMRSLRKELKRLKSD